MPLARPLTVVCDVQLRAGRQRQLEDVDRRVVGQLGPGVAAGRRHDAEQVDPGGVHLEDPAQVLGRRQQGRVGRVGEVGGPPLAGSAPRARSRGRRRSTAPAASDHSREPSLWSWPAVSTVALVAIRKVALWPAASGSSAAVIVPSWSGVQPIGGRVGARAGRRGRRGSGPPSTVGRAGAVGPAEVGGALVVPAAGAAGGAAAAAGQRAATSGVAITTHRRGPGVVRCTMVGAADGEHGSLEAPSP